MMEIYNKLPLFLECIQHWKSPPSQADFNHQYLKPLEKLLHPMLEDFGSRGRKGLYTELKALDWEKYRAVSLKLDSKKEESRVERHILQVENLLNTKLKGEVVLFGAFTMMDGYARFHQGTHRVFLGVDESHGRGAYLDVLMTHELTHVAREPQVNVWKGWGLSPVMTHDEFAENMSVIEHLMSEGFSCVVSEILNPNEDPSHYVYQTPESLKEVFKNAKAIDEMVHSEVQKKDGDYGKLYDVKAYKPTVPLYAHYVWAWQWVKTLLHEKYNHDPKKLLDLCSKDLIENALEFKLSTMIS